MTPTEQIVDLLSCAIRLASALEKAGDIVEKAAENVALFNNADEQIGHLQLHIRPEMLISNWQLVQIYLIQLQAKYDKDRLAKNRRARDYQKRARSAGWKGNGGN